MTLVIKFTALIGIIVFGMLTNCNGQHVNAQNIMESVMHHILKHQSLMKKQSFVNMDAFENISLSAKSFINEQKFPTSFFECISELNPQSPYFTKYLDSLAKPPTGLFQGNLQWLGNFDECMEIPDSHYCDMKNIAVYNHKFTLQTFGVCVPKKCSIYDVTTLLNTTATVLKKILESQNITIDIISVRPVDQPGPLNPFNPVPQRSKCLPRTDERSFSKGATVMIVISGIILALCFIGTVVDLSFDLIKSLTDPYYSEFKNELSAIDNSMESNMRPVTSSNNIENFKTVRDLKWNKWISFFMCFSIIRNTKAIFNTNAPSGAIASINGIRTFSITWVILGHLIGNALSSDNPTLILNGWIKRFSFQGISNAFVSVDTFFVLSGVLVGYLSFKRYESAGSLPLFRYYFHRYIRLTPSFLFLIFFMTYLFPYFGDGPNWVPTVEPNCEKYWWTNILYINNIYPQQEKVCYGVSWYLANDMQFYAISPLLMWIMYRFKLKGVLAVLGVVLLEFALANGLLMHYNDATQIIITTTDLAHPSKFSFVPYMKYIYFKPWTRIAPYVIGIVLGYILYYKKTINSRFSTLFYLIGWVIATGLGMAVVYGPYSAVNVHVWNEAETISYGIFFRVVWALAICWVIYACHHGYGSIIGDFLGWKAFIPLSRLTYGVYLIHIYVIEFYFLSAKTIFHASEVNLSFVFIPVIVISYILSYIVAVCIEYPVFNLEKLIFKY